MVSIVGQDSAVAKRITHRGDISGGPDGAKGFTCPKYNSGAMVI